MAAVGYRIGVFDDGQQGYPLELFDPDTGARLFPAAGAETELLPKSVVDKGPWTIQTIGAAFAEPATTKLKLVDMGRALFTWLDRGGIGAEWRRRRVLDEVTLLDVQDPGLRDLPWEFMFDGHRPIFGTAPGVTRWRAGVVAPPAASEWPMRLWIVKGATNDKAVKAEEEIRAIKAKLLWHRHSIDIKVDTPASPGEFETLLRQFRPHVLHFIGHSGVSAVSGLAALFVQAAVPWELDATSIDVRMANAGTRPRLAFLNACHTANRTAAFGLADAFADAGVPATLTMQGAIEGEAAGQFAAAVYKEIAEGKRDLAAAVSVARNTLDGMPPPRQWAFPVLSLRQSPEALLPAPPPLLDQRFNDTDTCQVFQQVRLFGGRADERRQLRDAICPTAAGATPRHLVVVVGQSRHGKSHIVKRGLECLTLRGHNTQYVEVADTTSQNQLTFLLDMFEPSDPGLVVPELVRAFRRFKWDAKQILERGAVTPWDGVTNVIVPRLDETELKSDQVLPLLAESALAALREASSAEAPLFIVLDEFRNASGELSLSKEVFNEFVWPLLLSRIDKGELPHVYVGLVLAQDDADHLYALDRYVARSRWVTVQDPPASEYDELVDELFGYLELSTLNGMDQISKGLKVSVGTTPTAELLRLLQLTADSTIPGKKHRTYVARSR